MKTGCPKEIKNNENRVGVTPNAVQAYIQTGHEFFIEKSASLDSAIKDNEYTKVGAKVLSTAAEGWKSVEMIIKVKEPLESEYNLMQAD